MNTKELSSMTDRPEESIIKELQKARRLLDLLGLARASKEITQYLYKQNEAEQADLFAGPLFDNVDCRKCVSRHTEKCGFCCTGDQFENDLRINHV